MGLVYRVHHRGWNIDLAVKSPRPKFFQTKAQKTDFTRECETWIKLGLHQHIVSCHYVRTLGGIPRVFAEYVEGGSLKDWIDSRKLYEGGSQEALKRILDIAIQMAWGLDYADEQGVVHQDVKPANVLMTSDGTAKITDFGLAKARAASGELAVARAGRTILVSSDGMTPAYCSPEQASKQALSRKTDIWSWAVGVLEMFVGGVCWHSGTAARTIVEHMNALQREHSDLPAMPCLLNALLWDCFEPAPQLRPKDFNEIALRLLDVHRSELNEEHARPEPRAAELLADGLNNRALSMMDLGKHVEAAQAWEEALAADPKHLETRYNYGLLQWRTARIDDLQLLTSIRDASSRAGPWRAALLRAQVELERDNCESKVALLEGLGEAAIVQPELQRLLQMARELLPRSRRCLRIFEGHTSVVSSVCFSADGRFALSGSADRTLKLWEVTSGRCLRTFIGHADEVRSVCMSGDGCSALSGSPDGTLKFWDLSGGRCLRTFKADTTPAASVCMSGDSRYAVSGSGYVLGFPRPEDDTVKLWDSSTGRCLRTFRGHGEQVTSVCVSSDGRYTISSSLDKTLRLWEVASGRCLRTFEGHKDCVRSVCLSSDCRYALSGSEDGALMLWELASGLCLRSFAGHAAFVDAVCLSVDGRYALSGGADSLKLWDVASGRCLRTFESQMTGVGSVCISGDGRFALSASGYVPGFLNPEYNTFKLWQLGGNAEYVAAWEYAIVVSGESATMIEVQFGQYCAHARRSLAEYDALSAAAAIRRARSLTGCRRRPEAFQLWQQLHLRLPKLDFIEGWEERTFEGHAGKANSVCLSPDGRYGLSGSKDKTLRFWDVLTGQCLKTFEGHTGEVESVCLSGDGRYALSGSGFQPDCKQDALRLWNISSGRCLRKFEGHTHEVQSVCFSRDGRYALSGSSDRTIKLWDVSSGRCLRTFEGHTNCVNSVCLSADGRYALSGSGDYVSKRVTGTSDDTLKLWELASGRCLRTFEGHTSDVLSVCMSGDGHYALSGAADKTLKFWELSSGRCLQSFQGHTEKVNSVCLSADGRFALSGAADNMLKLWGLSSGKCLKTFEGHMNLVLSSKMRVECSGCIKEPVNIECVCKLH